jgi:hypothetical protein
VAESPTLDDLKVEDGRCVVTPNRDDSVALTVLFFERQWPHAGALIVPRSLDNRDRRGSARALAEFAGRYETGLKRYTVLYLSAQ